MEVDDVTTQYRFMYIAGSFVFCIRVLASKSGGYWLLRLVFRLLLHTQTL